MEFILKILYNDIGPRCCLDVFGIGSSIQGAAQMAAAGLNYAAQIQANEYNRQSVHETNETNYRIQQEVNQTNHDLAANQNKWNIEQWQRENEYNSPSAQVGRYLSAGINPIAAMSSGGIGSGNAANLQSASMANQQFGNAMIPSHVDAPVLNPDFSFIDTLIKGRQLENDTKKTNADVQKTLTDVKKIEADTQAVLDGNKRANDLFPLQMKMNAETLSNLHEDTKYKSVLTKYQKVLAFSTASSCEQQYVGLLQEFERINTAKFSGIVQARNMQMQSYKIKAEVAAMSTEQQITWAMMRAHSKTDSGNRLFQRGFDWKLGATLHGESGFFGFVPKGSVSGDLSGSYGRNGLNSVGSSYSDSFRTYEDDALKGLQIAISLSKKLAEDTSNSRIADALLALKDYALEVVPLVRSGLRQASLIRERVGQSYLNPPQNSDSYIL